MNFPDAFAELTFRNPMTYVLIFVAIGMISGIITMGIADLKGRKKTS